MGYLGKLIPQKGVELLLEAQPALRHDTAALVVGFGSDRDWLAALTIALRRGDRDALEWLRDVGGLPVDPSAIPDRTDGDRLDVTFTGLLDHRYAPGALAAMDVQVVPSILEEAFGMVAAEGAAAGALPMVARHSGLAEVAAALETEVGRPGLFSFEPGEGAVRRLAEGIDRLLSLPIDEREELRRAVSSFVGGALDVGTDGGETPRCGRTRVAERGAGQSVTPSSAPSRPPRSAIAAPTRRWRADRWASRRPPALEPPPGPRPRTPSPGAGGSCRRG